MGDHDITAVFSDGAEFGGSTSVAIVQTVDAAATTTVVESSDASSVFGQNVTFTATVTQEGSSAATPAGDVEFFDGLSSLGTATLVDGVGELSTSALSVGDHDVTAVFTDGAEFSTSTSEILTQTVGQTSTLTTITSDGPDPSVTGQDYTVSVSVAPVAPGDGCADGDGHGDRLRRQHLCGDTARGCGFVCAGRRARRARRPSTRDYDGDADFVDVGRRPGRPPGRPGGHDDHDHE